MSDITCWITNHPKHSHLKEQLFYLLKILGVSSYAGFRWTVLQVVPPGVTPEAEVFLPAWLGLDQEPLLLCLAVRAGERNAACLKPSPYPCAGLDVSRVVPSKFAEKTNDKKKNRATEKCF